MDGVPEELMQVLQQISELSGVALDLLSGGGGGEAPPAPPEGGPAPDGGGAPPAPPEG